MSRPGFNDKGFSDEHKAVLRLAVEEFEDAYPGALPPNLTFALYYDAWETSAAFTWSRIAVRAHGVDPSIILVNEAGLENAVDDALAGSSIVNAFVATESLMGDDEDWDTQAMQTRIIFHEIAHIAGNHIPVSDVDMDLIFPSYNGNWFAERIRADDPSLPSSYATQSPAEFLAEALSDAYYNGPDAAPVSQFTADQLRRVLDGEVEEALEEGSIWRTNVLSGPSADPVGQLARMLGMDL